jgi:hypothetical protein
MVSVNADCMKRSRYRRDSQRGRQSCLRELHQLQLMRLKYGEALGATPVAMGTDAEAGPAAAAGPPASAASTPAAAAEAVQRTEAAATQVEGGISSNDEAPRTRGRAAPASFHCTPQEVAATVAEQRQKRAAEQQRE